MAKHSRATKLLMSQKARGKNNPFYGRKHSRATKQKLSRIKKGKNNPMFGRRHSEATRRKIRAARLKRIRKGRR